MINESQAGELIGTTAYGPDDQKLGKVGQVFLDDRTGEPQFATVNTGLFGMKESYVPISEATWSGDRLVVPYTKDQVKDAPSVDLDGGHLDHAEEERLWQHYGLSYDTTGTGQSGQSGQTGQTDAVGGTYADAGTTSGTDTYAATGTGTGTGHVDTTSGHDTSGPTTDDAMTRSEEHLEVGVASQEAGRARLRKYVTTEQETQTVPVRKEQAVIEREPITDGNVGDALDGPAISEEEHEVVLHEERAVADTVVEPVERVSLGTETVVDQETVTEDVRKEHVEVEGDVTDTNR
jgi:uncharacterized protein (TIGR02271 family)